MNDTEVKQLNLKEGQVIKNYKVLCELLEVKPTKGKGRDYHIKEFERYCRFHKQGQKFIIDEVYPEPLPKIDNRKNNGGHIANTTYEKLMDNLLINAMYDYDDSIIDFSFQSLFTDYIPLFTENYKKLNEIGYEAFAEKHKMSKGLVLLYQQKIKNIVSKCLETSLNRLQKELILTWQKTIKYTDVRGEQEFADEDLTKEIKDAEKLVYDEMEITAFARTNPKVNKNFKKKVIKKLDGVVSYWNVYYIELEEDIEEVEDNIDEIKIRFINTLHEAIRNKKNENEFGEVYNPYNSSTHREDTRRLDKLIWQLPEGYKDKDELDEEFYELVSGEDFNKDMPF